MTFEEMDEQTELDLARDMFLTGLDHLIKAVGDGSLDQLGGMGLVALMQDNERARNLLSLVDHHIIAAAERLDLPTVLCQGQMRRVLVSVLGVSKREAACRVGGGSGRTPDVNARQRPRAGPAGVGGGPADRCDERGEGQTIERALEKVDRRGFDPDHIANGEALLTENARMFPPEDLKLLANRVVDGIDSDGTVPNDELNEDRRYFHLPSTRDGAYVGDFRLTGTAGAKLKTLLDPFAKPGVDPSGEMDGRTYGHASTTPWRISATGNYGPATSRTPAVSRRR